jgi:hypothetical protein
MTLRLQFAAELPKGLSDFVKAMSPSLGAKVMLPAAGEAMKLGMRHVKTQLKSLPWSKQKTKDKPASGKTIKPMYRTLGIRKISYRNGNVVAAMGIKTKQGIKHAWILEEGTQPHTIVAGVFNKVPTGKKLLVFPKPFGRPRVIGPSNAYRPRKVAQHPGTKAGRYMQKTFESKASQIEYTFISVAKRRVNVVIHQVARAKIRRVIVGRLKAQGLKPTGIKFKK